MDHNQTQQNTLKESVLEKIRSGEVHMRSRYYYTLKVITTIAIVGLLFITSAFLVSFMIFSLRVGGRGILLGFGWQGIRVFVITFPWFLFLIEVILLYILERLLKQFRFGYRNPVIYLLASVFFISIVAGVFMDQAHVHSSLFDRSRKRQLPFFNGMYDHVRRPPREQGVCIGTVTAIQGSTFTVKEEDGESDEGTHIINVPSGMDISQLIKVGDTVIVASEVRAGQYYLYGVQKLDAINSTVK